MVMANDGADPAEDAPRPHGGSSDLTRVFFNPDAADEDALRIERQEADLESRRIEILFQDFRNEPL